MKRAHQSQIIPAQDSDLEFAIFLEELREYEQRCRIEEAQNAFLDAYSAWRKHPRDRAMNPAPFRSTHDNGKSSGQGDSVSAREYRRWLVERCGVKAHVILCAAYLSYLDPTFQGPRALRRYYTVSRE